MYISDFDDICELIEFELKTINKKKLKVNFI